MNATREKLIRYCQACTHNTADAEDLAHDAIVVVLRAKLPHKAAIGVARNLLRKRRSKAKRHADLTAANEDAIRANQVVTPSPDDAMNEALRKALAAEVSNAVAALPARDAWIVRARAVDEIGFADMLEPFMEAGIDPTIRTVAGLRTAFYAARKIVAESSKR